MLRYDAAWLMEQNRDEVPAHPGVPYIGIDGAGPYDIARAEGEFRLTSVIDVQPRLEFDETVVRLARYEAGKLCVQPCAYSDGMKSNYAMDDPGELREILRAEYGGRLPLLDDGR